MIGQRKATDFLRSAVRARAVSHGYLFVGPPGSGKKNAARALACAVLCEDDGCGACPICYRVKRGLHPDVHVISPQGATSYLVEQVRDVIRDVNLKPIQSQVKFYIFENAEMFNDASANAFLKTLEEPPDDTKIVLVANSYDSVLPTISSRCQVVRFTRMPPSVVREVLVEKTGADQDTASAALAASRGVLSEAIDFIRSAARRQARDRILGVLKDLPYMDELDVLNAARDVLALAKAPLDELRSIHEQELESGRDLGLSLRAIEERQKRELTSRERESVLELMSVTETWLRDCLAMSQGASELVLNHDAQDAMEEVAAVLEPQTAVRAMTSVRDARARLSCNVSPQLAIEAMLFEVREVLLCPR